MKEKELILGLDISTTTIGIALMSIERENIDIIKVSHCSPKVKTSIKGMESLFLKKKIFETELISQYTNIGVDRVVIEEPLIYGPNANAVAPLLRFNAMISDSIYNNLGIVPEYISSYDARSFAFPQLLAIRKFDKKGKEVPEPKQQKAKKVLFGGYPTDIDKKIIINDLISEKFPDIQWIYNNDGTLKKCSFDSSDAICCILGWIEKRKTEQ